jgi:hypothetical protein
MEMREWYYSENDLIYGPFPEDQVQKMIRNGQLTEDTIVWCGETDFIKRGWIRIADIELFSQIPINDDSFSSSSPTITSAPNYGKTENARTTATYVFSSSRQFDDGHRSTKSMSRQAKKKIIIGAISICIVLIVGTVGGLSFWYVQQQAKAKIMPLSAKEFKGKNYVDVITRLKSAGFTNIKTEIVDDLVLGWRTKDGEVERVSVNRRTNFNSGSKFPADAKIVITYHTFRAKH